MKLQIEEFEKAAIDKGYSGGLALWLALGGGEMAYESVKQNAKLGHEIVKNIYNEFGEEQTLKLVEFDDETIDGLKSKYIKVGNSLLGGISPHDGEMQGFDVDDYSDEHISLFNDKFQKYRLYPEWYFTKEFCLLNRWRFQSWMRRNNYTWEQVAFEIGITVEQLYWNVTRWKKWTMMDMICLMEFMGKKDLYDVIIFPTNKLRAEVKRMIFNENKERTNE